MVHHYPYLTLAISPYAPMAKTYISRMSYMILLSHTIYFTSLNYIKIMIASLVLLTCSFSLRTLWVVVAIMIVVGGGMLVIEKGKKSIILAFY